MLTHKHYAHTHTLCIHTLTMLTHKHYARTHTLCIHTLTMLTHKHYAHTHTMHTNTHYAYTHILLHFMHATLLHALHTRVFSVRWPAGLWLRPIASSPSSRAGCEHALRRPVCPKKSHGRIDPHACKHIRKSIQKYAHKYIID